MAEVSAAWAAPSTPLPAPPVPAATPSVGGTAPDGTGARRLEGVRPIPLRPLSVLELLDGAIGAVRALGTGMIARASAVAAVCSLAGLGVLWAFDAAMKSAIRIHPVVTTDYFGVTTVQYGKTGPEAAFGIFAVSVLIPTVFGGFAATIVAGLFSRLVREYIDGTGSSGGNGQGTNGARPAAPRIPRLCVLAAITAIPRVVFAGLFILLALAAANDPSGSYSGIYTLLIVVGAPLCFWFTTQFAVAAPASVLEGIGSAAALRRAGKLVSSGRWRVLWASLLTLIITTAVTISLIVLQYSIYYDHGISDLLNGDPVNASTYWWLAADVVVVALFSALTVPFRAAVAALLYVDRRFRREGLDIRIAWARVARANGGGKGR